MQVSMSDVQRFQVRNAKVEIHATRELLGAAAASAASIALRKAAARNHPMGVIFATGASQLETLRALVEMPGIPWERMIGFHMDEYVGLSPDHPASFRNYLRQRLTGLVSMKEFHEVDGSADDPHRVCREYAELLRAAAPEVCLLGIGENGHLAFNDPGVADFNDPQDVKIVRLDDACRQQQIAEGWFSSAGEVPDEAITITIPALLRVPRLIVSVPGARKAQIVRRTLQEQISTACPATILRTHPDVTIFLDKESAAELEKTPNLR